MPHFSFDKLVELAGGDEEFARELLQDFLNDTTECRENLKKSLGEQDAATARRSVHSVKGMAASAGADRLAELAFEAEEAAAAEDLARVTELLPGFEQELDAVQQEVREVLAGA